MSNGRARRLAATTSTIVMALGCGHPPPIGTPKPPLKVSWQDEAATASVSILSIAKWDYYVGALQPSFTLSPDQALGLATPITTRTDRAIIDALSASVGLAPPTSSRTASTTETASSNQNTSGTLSTSSSVTAGTGTSIAANGTATTTGTSQQTQSVNGSTSAGASGQAGVSATDTSTSAPGDVSKAVPQPPPSVGAAPQPTNNPLNGDVVVDPFTRYSAATALYQEVQLLDRYVRDIALKRNADVYVMRLDVSLLPARRGQAWDAYTTFALFVEPPARPTIHFTATPTSIVPGGSTLLQWSVTGADAVTIEPGIGTVQNTGSQYVSPSMTTPYRLSASNKVGTATRMIEITVAPPSSVPVPRNDRQPDARPKNDRSADGRDAEKFRAAVQMVNALSGQLIAPLLTGVQDQFREPAIEPTVVPILVTDSLEQSFGASSESYLRQFAVALSLLKQGFGASGQLGRQVQALQTALGQDTNSLLTVTKVSQNSVRVRFGAAQQLSSGLALVPRNHTVTLVVFVGRDKTVGDGSSQAIDCTPKDDDEPPPSRIRVTARTQLVDATGTSEPPALRSLSSMHGLLEKVVANYMPAAPVPPGPAPACVPTDVAGNIDLLTAYVQKASRQDFESHLASLCISTDASDRLWLDIVDTISKSGYSADSAELPPEPRARIRSGVQVLTAEDNNKTSSVSMTGLRGVSAADLLPVAVKSSGGEMVRQIFGSAAESKSNVLTFTFPSLKKSKVCGASSCSDVKVLLLWNRVQSKWNGGESQQCLGQWALESIVDVSEPPGPPARPTFTMTVGARRIVANSDGTASVRIQFARAADKSDERMLFSIQGADILGATSEPAGRISFGKDGWEVTDNARVSVAIGNAADDADIEVIGSDGKVKTDPIRLRVVRSPGKADR
jgi:hypothetical protein